MTSLFDSLLTFETNGLEIYTSLTIRTESLHSQKCLPALCPYDKHLRNHLSCYGSGTTLTGLVVLVICTLTPLSAIAVRSRLSWCLQQRSMNNTVGSGPTIAFIEPIGFWTSPKAWTMKGRVLVVARMTRRSNGVCSIFPMPSWIFGLLRARPWPTRGPRLKT